MGRADSRCHKGASENTTGLRSHVVSGPFRQTRVEWERCALGCYSAPVYQVHGKSTIVCGHAGKHMCRVSLSRGRSLGGVRKGRGAACWPAAMTMQIRCFGNFSVRMRATHGRGGFYCNFSGVPELKSSTPHSTAEFENKGKLLYARYPK